MKKINTPLTEKVISGLKAGEEVLLSGIILTARDQAHLRLCGLIEKKEDLPIELDGQVIYYCGPTPSADNVIGSCGPTTSSRMDSFTPALLGEGVKGMIGKGRRSSEVREAIKHEKAVYFAAPAGAGAYLKSRVLACEVVAFPDLGPEAIHKLTVEDFPLIVVVDAEGADMYARFN
jgi:fumarate hydratase subunit beta